MNYTLITGATGGLGVAFCEIYAKNNNNLILVATNEKKLQALQQDLKNRFDVAVEYIVADLSDQTQLQEVFDRAQKLGFVNNLINNAGFGDRTDFKDMDAHLQLQMINVNCTALLYFTRKFLADMLQRNQGKIINVGSIAGFVPGPYMCTYHATKAFVLNLGEAIAHEIRKTKVKILTLCPGPFTSNFVEKAGNDYTFKKIKPVSAQKIAETGYKYSQKGKRICVVGFKNKLTVFAPRFFSRKFVAKVSASQIKQQD